MPHFTKLTIERGDTACAASAAALLNEFDGEHTELDHVELMIALTQALAATHAGICLCDEQDNIRYVNPAFSTAFFLEAPRQPRNFVEALAEAIARGKGIRLESRSLPEFIERTKRRRRTGNERYDFAVDLVDGTWWWINDRRLSNGWMLAVATDISSVKQEEFRLRNEHASAVTASQTDFLTGLANRRHGMELAQIALEEHRANRLPLSIAILDIDHFKRVNDVYGHHVGDEALVAFARALRHGLKAHDQVSRLGGEEFMVVMPETSASRAAGRLQKLMRNMPPVEQGFGSQPLRIWFSAGLAEVHHKEDLKSILARADAALYTAKVQGRRRVEVSRSFDEAA